MSGALHDDAIHHLDTSPYMYFDDLQTYLADQKKRIFCVIVKYPKCFFEICCTISYYQPIT